MKDKLIKLFFFVALLYQLFLIIYFSYEAGYREGKHSTISINLDTLDVRCIKIHRGQYITTIR